jgi:serine/threonine protein kinase
MPPTPPATVPCQVRFNWSEIGLASDVHQYRTGRTLGSGTYAIVKEAIHVRTGKYYACKVINKKLMEGREHMVCTSNINYSCLPK